MKRDWPDIKYVCPNTGKRLDVEKVGGVKLFEGWRFPATIRLGGQKVCAHCGEEIEWPTRIVHTEHGPAIPPEYHWVVVHDGQRVLGEFEEKS